MESAAVLSDNTITANTADNGGGLFLERSNDATLSGNTVFSNTAAYHGVDGFYLEVHEQPAKALSDAATQLPLKDLPDLLKRLAAIHKASG